MKKFSFIKELTEYLQKEKKAGKTIGFIPTMGALHDGHLSMIRMSLEDNDLTVCSIFVNPIQFNNKDDLEKYPRSLDQDKKMLAKAGCDVLFAPGTEEIYPRGRAESLAFDFGHLDKILEGKYRPGHFQGVAIVVKKFFEIIKPDKAYFGKKDFQQLLIVRKLVSGLNLPVEIIACPIVREPDGLAMSSRNLRLTVGERGMAPLIYSILQNSREQAGMLTVRGLKNWAIKKIQENPAFRVEYFEIVDKETLLPLENWKSKEKALACTAVYLGDVRLIDNIELFL